MDRIDSFEGQYRWLSNFWPASFRDRRGKLWPSSESYYMAHKTMDPVEREKIRTMSPGKAKKYGKTVELRPDWNEVRDKVMKWALWYKFTQNEDLREKLLATDNRELVEGNYWHDLVWGVCSCVKCKGHGENRLGQYLMQLRDKLREIDKEDS